MTKRHILATLVILLSALARTAEAVPAEKTYDFRGITGPSASHTAWSSGTAASNFTTTTLVPAGEAELATANYQQIRADDATNTAGLCAAKKLLRHFRFNLKVAEAPATITELRPSWVGSSAGPVTKTLYIWNFTTAAWVSRGTHTATVDTLIDGGAITTASTPAIGNVIDGTGNVYLAAVADAETTNFALEHRTDHARLVVKYDAATTVPDSPTGLQQLEADRTRVIALGGSTATKPVVFRAAVTDPDAGATLRLAVEAQLIAAAFTGVASNTGSPVASGATAQVEFAPPANGDYHWQVWAIDQFGAAGPKVSFGANPETAKDFTLAGAASTYFVDKTGLDSNHVCAGGEIRNDIANPHLTLSAAMACLRDNNPNLTGLGRFAIQIQDGGTYAETLLVRTLTATAADNLTVRSRPGEVPRPLVDGGASRLVGIGVAVPFTVVDGIRFTNFSGAADYGSGIRINASDCEVKNCTVFATPEFGVIIGFDSGGGEADAKSDRTNIHHNVFTDIRANGIGDLSNQGDGIHIMMGSSFTRIENNSFNDCDQSAVFMMPDAPAETDTTIKNNVMVSTAATTRLLKIGSAASGGQTGLISNHNTLFRVGSAGFTGLWGTVDQATLPNWRTASAKDAKSRDLDPLFVDALAGDLHLLSDAGYRKNDDPTWYLAAAGVCSPAIDFGDPTSPYPKETADHGSRVNQGAYGNSASGEASRSCACREPMNTAGGDLNDTLDATRVCPLVRSISRSGAEAAVNDTTDWYFFNNLASGTSGFKFDMTITSVAQFDLFLYDAAGTLVASDAPGAAGTTGPAATRTVSASLAPGLYYVESRYVSGTSTYTLVANATGPLSASLHSFTATEVDGVARVSWATELESDATGFRLRRSTDDDDRIVGPNPIEVNALGEYVQDDWDAVAGSRYDYFLEEMKPDGTVVTHGPVALRLGNAPRAGGCGVSLSDRVGRDLAINAALLLLPVALIASAARRRRSPLD